MIELVLGSLTLLGAPLGLLSFFVYRSALRSGNITVDQSFRHLKKDMRSSLRANKNKAGAGAGQFNKRWMKFGGGFYGLMAVYTYVIIEIKDIIYFFQQFESLSAFIDQFGISMIIEIIINALTNFIHAAIWFKYWGDYFQMNQIFIWCGIAYGCYYAGFFFARHVVGKEANAPFPDQ